MTAITTTTTMPAMAKDSRERLLPRSLQTDAIACSGKHHVAIASAHRIWAYPTAATRFILATRKSFQDFNQLPFEFSDILTLVRTHDVHKSPTLLCYVPKLSIPPTVRTIERYADFKSQQPLVGALPRCPTIHTMLKGHISYYRISYDRIMARPSY